MTALAIEVQVEAGVEPLDLLHAKQAEQAARSAYALALHHERIAIRIAEERGPTVDCPRCLRCEVDGVTVQTLLCGRHSAQLHALRQSIARRITAQRVLAEAQYALERIRKGMR